MARSDSQVPSLIERIRKLVAEQRRLEENGGNELEASRRELARLQTRLANVVRRELKTRTSAILDTPQRA